jgi:hypothetical protein
MQRYIATSIQRRDSNISMNWGMVDDGVGILPSVFFWRWSTKTTNQLVRRVGGATMKLG